MAVQTPSDSKPVILTLYSYADGTVVFAESDGSNIAGRIDRVILKVAPVMRAVFGEAR